MSQRVGLNCCLQPNDPTQVSSVAKVPFDFMCQAHVQPVISTI